MHEQDYGPAKSLLAAAALVLRSHAFGLRTVPLTGMSTQLLLAENELFLLGLVEFPGPDHLAAVESAAALDLAERLDQAAAKRWDAYLVLLTDSPAANQEMSAAVADILYNTRYLRRIIRWELAPSDDSLTTALKPFLPLPDAGRAADLLDPMQALVARMVAHGIAPEDATEALELWRATRDDDYDQ